MDTITANSILHTLDPVAFAIDLGFTPDQWQAQVLRWSGQRLIMNCCRQSGKSTTAAILGLHRALYFSGSLVLLVSPSLRQSSELFRKVAGFLGLLSIKPRLLEDNRLSCTLENKSRIVSLPSTEATVRGFSGANLIIEDEASRVDDDLYKAIRPMLAVSNGRLILMSTPFGLRGHFYTEWAEGQGWERVRIPATECPRITPEFLEEERKSLGELWFRSEYLCEFTDNEGALFNTEQLMKSFSKDVKPLFSKEVRQLWKDVIISE